MSRDRCCVPKCHESGRSHQVLHGFPNPEKDPNRFREWVMAVGGDILGLNNHYIYKQRRVCHEHFDIKYCCRYNRISNIAVPAMNMPRPIDIPKITIVERRPFKTMTNLMLDCPSTSKGLQLWGSAADLNTIFVLQKRAIRSIYSLRPRDSLREVFKAIDILTFKVDLPF